MPALIYFIDSLRRAATRCFSAPSTPPYPLDYTDERRDEIRESMYYKHHNDFYFFITDEKKSGLHLQRSPPLFRMLENFAPFDIAAAMICLQPSAIRRGAAAPLSCVPMRAFHQADAATLMIRDMIELYY